MSALLAQQAAAVEVAICFHMLDVHWLRLTGVLWYSRSIKAARCW